MDARSVYIGSIPFDYTEEQVSDIAKSVGPVSDLKLLFDPVSGKSKGYAFVRYGDHETAASAVRNLNNLSIGNRYLKCAFSSDDQAFPEDISASMPATRLPPLPLGVQLFQNQSAQQAISGILSSLDLESAGRMLKEARTMSLENPLLMKKLLDQCPQLGHALVETSLMVNATNKELIELCLNRAQPELRQLSEDHVSLLRQINLLSKEDLDSLDEGKRKVVNDIKNEMSKGSYGIID